MSRPVTERDLRHPDYVDGDPSDYEFRELDNKVVRKDRWEKAVQSIHVILTGGRREFEIPDVVNQVRELVADRDSWLIVEESMKEKLLNSEFYGIKLQGNSVYDITIQNGSRFLGAVWRSDQNVFEVFIQGQFFSLGFAEIKSVRYHTLLQNQ